MSSVSTAAAREVYQKTPVEVRIINVEFSGRMETGETISSIQSVTITPAGLVKDTDIFSGTKAQLKLSAGTLDIDYEVNTRVLTSTGQVLECKGTMQVRT